MSTEVMTMHKTVLEKRNIPSLLDREAMISVLLEEEYGNIPAKPKSMIWHIKEDIVKGFCANKATYSQVTLHCDMNGTEFSFPFSCVIPKKDGKHPFFIHINFRPDVPDRYMPTEELVDNGFAILSFCYQDVTSDNEDMTSGLSGVLYPDGKRKTNDPGKIAMWAWAAQRVMDYAETVEQLDTNNAIVCGHSRLGKTALLAAATDERFTFAHSNDSGCSGAAITRGKVGEQVSDICHKFPYWFCENYLKYIDNEQNMPFDQHFLVASIAPRCVSIGSAIEDVWADPYSEMLTCIAASSMYERLGKKGFIYENKEQKAGDIYQEGRIGYYVREGTHYFSREDWHKLIHFIKKHKN